uniref:ADAM metallopeptidase domain 23a n=1 Tax=Monopterus albus TaxID=43700 RepID=A0A3Q3QKV5_MONAL
PGHRLLSALHLPPPLPHPRLQQHPGASWMHEESLKHGTSLPALLKQQATAAPVTDNTTHHAVEHVITYPSRLIFYLNEDSESTYHDLDTRAVHLAQASFQLEAFGSRFVLDLTLNTDLLSSDYVEIHYEGGKPVLSKGGEHCYYHGEVRGNDNSHVALSTCNGLHGMFDDGAYVYLIEPLQQTHSIVSHSCCREPKYASYICFSTQLFSELDDLSWLKRRKKRAMPRSIFEEMKYLEIMIVSDHSLTKPYMRNFAKSVVNIIFKEQLHTRVVLVAVEIWTDKDQIPISVRPLEMLRDFSKYRQQSIKHHADAVHLFSNVTFHYRRSSAAYFGGMCSISRGVGVNEYGTTGTMAGSLSQSLAQNLGIQWDPASKRKECGCADSWTGCIMEDTGVQHPRRFSKCSISDYKEFLLKGGGSCLFNRPTKLFQATECGNGFVEVGEECDCGARAECYKECCKKCSLANGAHCSDGPCCNITCLFYPRGYGCRYAVNDCDISETCSGDSGQCPPNLHKQDGYLCQVNQGRCYNGECKTRESQCKYIWGPKAASSEKLTMSLGLGRGFSLAYIQPVEDDETDLGYVEDGTPCGPSMMCLDRKCLPIQSLNTSTCPSGPNGQVCSAHGVCNNEATCTCDTTWAGTDCSMPDPPKEPPTQDEGPKGPSATNLIIGSIAGAILVAAIVLGGTGWGFK